MQIADVVGGFGNDSEFVGTGRPGDALHVGSDVSADEVAGRGSRGVKGLQVEAGSVRVVIDEVGVVFVGVFLLFGCGLRIFGQDGEPTAVSGEREVVDVEG